MKVFEINLLLILFLVGRNKLDLSTSELSFPNFAKQVAIKGMMKMMKLKLNVEYNTPSLQSRLISIRIKHIPSLNKNLRNSARIEQKDFKAI